MQFVPIIPRPRNLLEERLEVKRLAAVKAAKPVQPRTLPPLVAYAHAAPPRDQAQPEERRAPLQEERRSYCRRITHLPVLEELRSAIYRRKNTQRETDQAEHIDVEA
jgi:hypothetical protein